MRMSSGDRLIEYPTRVFLHTCEPSQHITTELCRGAVCALLIRGLVYPEKENGIERQYSLTEEGELISRYLIRQL